eukprot:4479742-Amphidinium_carterae.1
MTTGFEASQAHPANCSVHGALLFAKAAMSLSLVERPSSSATTHAYTTSPIVTTSLRAPHAWSIAMTLWKDWELPHGTEKDLKKKKALVRHELICSSTISRSSVEHKLLYVAWFPGDPTVAVCPHDNSDYGADVQQKRDQTL